MSIKEALMSKTIVECIPNFSEARHPEVIQEIREAILKISGVIIIDQHSDQDHNRTVITMIGPPEAIEKAAFEAIKKASELINLNQHTGQHPRIGATDVVPFVPIKNCTIIECIEIARRLGKRVGVELDIPVYLYEEAATKPERKRLENIRRGQYETLKKEILTKPTRQPDFGPNKLGTAGAVAIGARNPLIAFNVYLNSNNATIAKNIASTIRHSSGGLRGVKALGMSVDGLAQVSMNLTDYKKTSIHHVVEMIRRESQRYGTSIHHSELVGLIPQKALIDSAQWYLQLDQFSSDQILESRIASAIASSTNSILDNTHDSNTPPNQDSSQVTEISAIIHTTLLASQLCTRFCREEARQSNSNETVQRLITLIERLDSLQTNIVSSSSQITQHQDNLPVEINNHNLDPEKVASNIVKKEHHQKILVTHLSNLLQHNAEVVFHITLIQDNSNIKNPTEILTSVKLAKGAYDALRVVSLHELSKVRDSEFAKAFFHKLESQDEIVQNAYNTICSPGI